MIPTNSTTKPKISVLLNGGLSLMLGRRTTSPLLSKITAKGCVNVEIGGYVLCPFPDELLAI